MPLLELPARTLGRHNSSNALEVSGMGIAAAHSLWGRIRDGAWLMEDIGIPDGLGEEPACLGEGLGRGEPPRGEAAVKGEPTPRGDGVGNWCGDGAGLALG